MPVRQDASTAGIRLQPGIKLVEKRQECRLRARGYQSKFSIRPHFEDCYGAYLKWRPRRSPTPTVYDVRMYACITNIQAQITSKELVGIWPPLPSRR